MEGFGWSLLVVFLGLGVPLLWWATFNNNKTAEDSGQKTDSNKLASILLRVGSGFLAFALIWWASSYGSIRHTGEALGKFFACLLSSTGKCVIAETSYTPVVFWIGAIAIVIGVIMKATSERTAQSKETPVAKPKNTKQDFCAYCGAALKSKAHFCVACGRPAEAVTPNTHSAASTTKSHSSVSKTAPWTRDNDQLVEEIVRSNTQPHDAIESIKELLVKGININAQNAQGRTTLSIAKYHECPSMVIALLINAGAKE